MKRKWRKTFKMSPVHSGGDKGGSVLIFLLPQLDFKHCYVLNAFRSCFYVLPEILYRHVLVCFSAVYRVYEQSEFLRQLEQSGQGMKRDHVAFYTVDSSQYVFLSSFSLNLSVLFEFHSLISHVQKINKGSTVITWCSLSKLKKLPSPARICSPVTNSVKMEWEGKMAEFVQGEEELSDSEEGLLRAMAQLQLRREKKVLPIVYEKNETYNPDQTKSSVACQCWIGVEQLAFYGPPGASLQLPYMTSPGSLMSASTYPAEEEKTTTSTPQPMDTGDQPARKKWKPDATIEAPEVESASPAPNQETPATGNDSPAANDTAPAKKPRRRWPQGRRKALAKQRAEAAAAAEAATLRVESPLQHPQKKAKKPFNSSFNSSSAKPTKPAMKSVVAQNPAKGGGQQQQNQQPSHQQQQPSHQQQQQPKQDFGAQGAKPKINRQKFKPDARRKINRNKEKRFSDGSLIPPMTEEEIRIRNEEWRQFRLTGVDNQAPRNVDYRLSDPSFPRIVDNAAMNPPVVPLDGRNRDVKHAAYVMAEHVKQERARAANVVASPLEPANYVMPPLERIVVYDPPPQPIPQQPPQPQPLPFPELLRAMAAQLEATQKK